MVARSSVQQFPHDARMAGARHQVCTVAFRRAGPSGQGGRGSFHCRAYTDVAPPEPLLRLFKERRDNQIGGLEVLSIALGLATFEPLLSGRCVNIFSDNSGSEWAVRSGAAKQFDHTCLVHSIWRMALGANCNMHVQRVASEDNIADLPSRESYSLLYRLGAEWIPPVLDDAWFDPSAWLPHRRP